MGIDPSHYTFRTVFSRKENVSKMSSDNPISSIVKRCLAQYTENRSGKDSTKELMGTRLFKAYAHLSTSDQLAIRQRLVKIRDQSLNKKENLENKRAKPTKKQANVLKKAKAKYEAAAWALKNLETGGLRKPTENIPEIISIINLGADLTKFGENPFGGIKPKKMAEAFIAQDLMCIQQVQQLSDIAPAQEKTLGILMTRNDNRLSNFVIGSVLLAPNISTATKRVKYFIKVMEVLESFQSANKRKGNHISFLTIGDALNGPAISRLSSIQKSLSKKERQYLYGQEGAYRRLRSEYLTVPKALKQMPTAALFSPSILSTFLEGASNNALEDHIDIVSKVAIDFGNVLRDAKEVELPIEPATLSIPKLPPEDFSFPDDFSRTGNDQEDYLYYLSKQLQEKV